LEVAKTIFVLEAILLASKLVGGLRGNYVGIDGEDDATKMANTKNTKILKNNERDSTDDDANYKEKDNAKACACK
jgi:hypothetical protein